MSNNINVITQKEELYDKCENMEELYDKYYLPLLEKHYKKTYILEQALDENNKLKIQISDRETLCEEYEQLINTILNFPFFKEECPLNFGFEDN